MFDCCKTGAAACAAISTGTALIPNRMVINSNPVMTTSLTGTFVTFNNDFILGATWQLMEDSTATRPYCTADGGHSVSKLHLILNLATPV